MAEHVGSNGKNGETEPAHAAESSGSEQVGSAGSSALPEEPAKRVIGRPFPKGVSGNPGGMSAQYGQLMREYRAKSPLLFSKLYMMALRGDRWALGYLLDRLWGKTPDRIAGHDGGPLDPSGAARLSEMTTGEKRARLAELLAKVQHSEKTPKKA